MRLHHLLASALLLAAGAASGCASTSDAAATEPTAAANASFGCMMKSMMCSSWTGLGPSQIDKATQQCTSDAGQALAECPSEGRVATCDGATSPSGNPMPDVHFYAGGAAPEAEGVLTVAERICKENGGTLSKATTPAP
ncbi:MAG: hypothetical protein IPM79_17520 [Polyangiaceae bacterium]|jgi:hypothetical protein|nr:hypothetical protein [Polyangiaceae bacterium]MBK8939368.1 hypothetical protein [Polyangiaceae bacterium]